MNDWGQEGPIKLTMARVELHDSFLLTALQSAVELRVNEDDVFKIVRAYFGSNNSCYPVEVAKFEKSEIYEKLETLKGSVTLLRI